MSLIAGFLGTAVAGGAGLAFPPAGFGVAVVFATWVAALGRHIAVEQKIVRDPPDYEFRSAIRVAGVPFNLESLPDDGFGQANAAALASLLRASSFGSAMVRALERSQGAALAGERDFEEERFSQAVQFAQLLGQNLQDFVGSIDRVVSAVRDLPPVSQVLPQGGRLIDLLPDGALAALYRAGVVRGDLNVPVMERVSVDPRDLFVRGLRELAGVAGEEAALLSEAPSQGFAGTAGR